MKRRILYTISLSLIAIILLIAFGCTSRLETPVLDENSTLIFPPKNIGDISVNITFCRKTNRKTGEPIGAGSAFTIMEKGKVQAIVDIKNRFFHGDKKLLFHIDWIGPDGKSMYLKQIILSPDDSSSTIKSSISILPENREPGEHKFQVYYFRELIAERKFELLPRIDVIDLVEQGFSTDIVLCTKLDKKTGKRIGIDSTFTIKEKGKVRAYYDLVNHSELCDRELLFRFNWIGPNDSSFYNKLVDISPFDSTSIIGSSISISPGKREPGNSTLQLYLFNELIATNKFELLPEPEIIPIKLNTKITLYRKLDKKTGKRVDEGTVFTLKNKRKVRAYIDLKNRQEYIDRKLELQLKWVGPDGESIYRKGINIAAGDLTSEINSSISISPDKRPAGKYRFKLYLFDELIAEKKFVLLQSN